MNDLNSQTVVELDTKSLTHNSFDLIVKWGDQNLEFAFRIIQSVWNLRHELTKYEIHLEQVEPIIFRIHCRDQIYQEDVDQMKSIMLKIVSMIS